MHTQETFEVINKRYEKRETKREAKALIAAKLDTAIEKELLNRLQAGTYKDIYNLQQENFNKALDEEEIVEEEFQVDEDSEENDDSLIGADLGEEGEFEMSELSEGEIRELEEEEENDRLQVEQVGSESEQEEKPVLKKRAKPVSLSYEYEFEREDGTKQVEKVAKSSSKRRATSKSTAHSGESVDF